MSNPLQTTASDPAQTPASDPAQVTPTAPTQTPPNQYADQYTFQGGGITIQYGSTGGPPTTYKMTYRDPSRILPFDYDEVDETEIAALGKVVSVTIVPGGTDSPATTFSVVLPPVVLPPDVPSGPAVSGSVHAETFGITTIHNNSVGPSGLGQNATYTVTNLSGDAAYVNWGDESVPL
jgi:hypothetical protein